MKGKYLRRFLGFIVAALLLPGVVTLLSSSTAEAQRRVVIVRTYRPFYRPWGWGYNRFDWGAHTLIINNAPWRRGWGGRGEYVHPYPGVRRYAPAERIPERHELHERTERERAAPREGRGRVEEHRGRR